MRPSVRLSEKAYEITKGRLLNGEDGDDVLEGINGNGDQVYTQVIGPDTATLEVDPTISVNANILL